MNSFQENKNLWKFFSTFGFLFLSGCWTLKLWPTLLVCLNLGLLFTYLRLKITLSSGSNLHRKCCFVWLVWAGVKLLYPPKFKYYKTLACWGWVCCVCSLLLLKFQRIFPGHILRRGVLFLCWVLATYVSYVS